MRRRMSWIGRCLVLCLSLPLPAAAAGAQSPDGTAAAPRLTLREAVERALGAYPAVGAARAEREAASQGIAEAAAAKRPRLSAAATGIYYDLPALTTPIHAFDFQALPEFDRSLFQGAVTLDYLVTDGGGRAARIRQRTAQRAAAEAALTAVQQATAARTAATYLEVLTQEKILDAHRRRIGALEAERDRVARRLAAGRAAEVDLRRVEASLAAARAERVRIDAALVTARADLARLVFADLASTVDRLAPVALAERALPGRDELLATARAASPEVAQAAQALAAAEAGVGVARALHRPQLHAVGNVLEFGSALGDFQTEWNASLRVAVPIATGGADRAQAARSEAARDAAAERLRLAELAVGESLDRALAATRESRARAESLTEAVIAFAEVVRIEKLRLEAGVGTETDYLSGEADLLAARAQLAAAGNGEIAARVELARVGGGLDLDWFDRTVASQETAP